MNWTDISKQGNLSEDFIREHKEALHWEYLCKNQTLSFDFSLEHIPYIPYVTFVKQKTLSKEKLEALKQPFLSFWKQHIALHILSVTRTNQTQKKVLLQMELHPHVFPNASSYYDQRFEITILVSDQYFDVNEVDFQLKGQVGKKYGSRTAVIMKNVNFLSLIDKEEQRNTIYFFIHEILFENGITTTSSI